MRTTMRFPESLLVVLLLLMLVRVGNGFQVTRQRSSVCRLRRENDFLRRTHAATAVRPTIPTTTSRLSMSSEDDGNTQEYSRKIRLREEVESPFSKVRFLLYVTLSLGALTSLAVSAARIAAALSGINEDLLQESVVNAAVDVGGLALIAFLVKRDLDAKDSRLKRASKGAELAKLKIRGSRRLLGDDDDSSTFTTSLSSLRRGRGIEKRVVIAAAGNDKMSQVLNDASDLEDSLTFNDLLVVPVVLPRAQPPSVGDNYRMPECVAFPFGDGWKAMIDDEVSEARNQGVDVESEGISIVLKKNGRVGQRTKGVYLRNMVGEVEARRESGMDVRNI